MLYATTRSNVDIYTAQRVLREERAADGGLFVPMTLPPFLPYEIRQLTEKSPAEAVSMVLNRFFQCNLTEKDIEFAIGREFFATTEIPYRIVIGELWRNPEGEADRLVRLLAKTVAGDRLDFVPGEWTQIAVRIALLAALCGEMGRRKLVSASSQMDVAVAAGEETTLMAAWYARRMGLPIHRILVSCNENSGMWDLVYRGQVRCGGPVRQTSTPNYDNPGTEGMERLIFSAFGRVESNRFVTACGKGTSYLVNSEQQRFLEEGLYLSVIGSKRVMRTIPNVYGSYRYVLCPYSALVYCGIMDYRAETGAQNPVLLLSGHSPMNSREAVTSAMGISEQELRRRLNLK